MPLVTDRMQVLEIYSEAVERKWVLPTFNSENLTTSEAILQAVHDFGRAKQIPDLPVIIGITCRYPDRPQSELYAHNREWHLGLRLFLSDLKVLTAANSPYARLRVMIHLDHIQWDLDSEVLSWDMDQFSSIMYDATTLPLEENIGLTARFVDQQGRNIIIEGACDEIGYGGSSVMETEKAAVAEDYFCRTGVDLLAANLGTEHRSSVSKLKYDRETAQAITQRIGPKLCLHGTSSVEKTYLAQLFEDGIRKVNLWTALERESTYILFREMLQNTAKMIGPEKAQTLLQEHLLGESADYNGTLSLPYFTTTYRQQIIFKSMQQIVTGYLNIWYR
jgi:fructose/tagatose bisphosphate aldolase